HASNSYSNKSSFSKRTDKQPQTIAIPVPSDKKLVKLSKLIPAPASFCFKLLETIVDITVLVNDSPPKTKTNIIVSNHGVTSKKKAAIKKLTESNVTPMVNTYNGPFLSTSNPPM